MVDYYAFCGESDAMISNCYDDQTPPTEILNIAIRKRRELFDQKEPDLCRELLNKTLIQHLCQQLGQNRSSRKSRRHRSRSASKRRRSVSQEEENPKAKRPCDHDGDKQRLVIDEQKGDDSCNYADFGIHTNEDSQVSMVHQSEKPPIDYAQTERMLDSSETIHYNGYVAHWSTTDSHDLSTSLKVNSLPVLTPELQLADSPSSPPPLDSELNANDPLEMDALFQELYCSSYSIIQLSKG